MSERPALTAGKEGALYFVQITVLERDLGSPAALCGLTANAEQYMAVITKITRSQLLPPKRGLA